MAYQVDVGIAGFLVAAAGQGLQRAAVDVALGGLQEGGLVVDHGLAQGDRVLELAGAVELVKLREVGVGLGKRAADAVDVILLRVLRPVVEIAHGPLGGGRVVETALDLRGDQVTLGRQAIGVRLADQVLIFRCGHGLVDGWRGLAAGGWCGLRRRCRREGECNGQGCNCGSHHMPPFWRSWLI